MPLFTVCDLTLEASEMFPELPPAADAPPHLRFTIGASFSPAPGIWEWFHHWELPSGATWLRMGRWRGRYLLRFPDYADFLFSPESGEICCYPAPETPPETIRHLFLDQVMPLVLSHRGEVVLHASAVAGPAGAIAFAGMSGCGKSTLAASLCEQGLAMLTDDCFLLRETGEGFLALPSYPGLRLWDDSLAALQWPLPERAAVSHYTDKKRVAAGNGRLTARREALTLARLYLLAPPAQTSAVEAVAIAAVPPLEALIELVQCAYCLDVADRTAIRRQFEGLGRIAAGAEISRLRFPHDYGRIAEVCRAILEDAGRL